MHHSGERELKAAAWSLRSIEVKDELACQDARQESNDEDGHQGKDAGQNLTKLVEKEDICWNNAPESGCSPRNGGKEKCERECGEHRHERVFQFEIHYAKEEGGYKQGKGDSSHIQPRNQLSVGGV